MAKRKKRRDMSDISLNPESRLAAEFDSAGIRKSEVASRDKMGVRVVDNCAQEHQQ